MLEVRSDSTRQKFSGRGLKRLMFYIRPLWPVFLGAMIANMVFAGVDSYSTYLFKPLLDKGFVGKDIHFLKMFPLIIIGLFVLRGLASFCGSYALGWIGARLVLQLRSDLFNKFIEVPSSFFDRNNPAKLLSKFTFNVDQVAYTTGQSFSTLVQQSFFVFGLLVVMLSVSTKLTLIVFLIIPLVALLVRYVTRRFRILATRIQETMGDLNHIVEESLSGQKEVKIFGAQDFQRKIFMGFANYNFRQSVKMTLTGAANSPVIQFLASLSLALIVFMTFHHGVSISAGSFVTFLAAMMAILRPLKQLTQVNADIARGLAAIDSLFEVLDEPAEQDEGQLVLEQIDGNIVFENVSFAYGAYGASGEDFADQEGEKTPVLNNISLEIPKGKTIAFVGRSGAGKTTLMNLLARFYAPTTGRILIDGVDIQHLKLSNLRRHLALVSQHVVLFDDTVMRNMSFGDCVGDEKVTRERVIAAAKSANAWEFIQKLPLGLETKIGQNGMALSGGQRQRLAIARAILKNAPILILDEATSALDAESERLIQASLDNLRAGRTTLIIAHRLSTIEKADWIVVMDQGKIIEQGDHKRLMAQKGVYYSLHQHPEEIS
jgi:subfamily B ATP-binding cassette protein MsbA